MAVVLKETTASIFKVDACGNVWIKGRVVGVRICEYCPEEGGSKQLLNISTSPQITFFTIRKNLILLFRKCYNRITTRPRGPCETRGKLNVQNVFMHLFRNSNSVKLYHAK
jgi:hypothetical protein